MLLSNVLPSDLVFLTSQAHGYSIQCWSLSLWIKLIALTKEMKWRRCLQTIAAIKLPSHFWPRIPPTQ